MHFSIARVDGVWALDRSRLLRVFFVIFCLLCILSAKKLIDLFVGVFYGLCSVVCTEFDDRTNAFHPQFEGCWAFLLSRSHLVGLVSMTRCIAKPSSKLMKFGVRARVQAEQPGSDDQTKMVKKRSDRQCPRTIMKMDAYPEKSTFLEPENGIVQAFARQTVAVPSQAAATAHYGQA
jgi:hypothetical protein